MLGREGQKKRRQRKLHFNRLTDRPIDASRFRATGLDWANRNHRLSPRAISAPASLRSLVLSHQIKRLLQSAGLRSSFDPHRRFSITRLRHTSQMPCPLSDALPTPNAVPPLVLMHVWHCWYTWVFHNGWNTPVPAPMQAPKNMHLPGLDGGPASPEHLCPAGWRSFNPPPKNAPPKRHKFSGLPHWSKQFDRACVRTGPPRQPPARPCPCRSYLSRHRRRWRHRRWRLRRCCGMPRNGTCASPAGTFGRMGLRRGPRAGEPSATFALGRTSLEMPLETLSLYKKRTAEAKANSANPSCPRLQQLPAAAPDMLAPAPQTVLGRSSARGRQSRRLG